MFEIITDALIDSIKMLPLLYLIYLIIEYFERRNNDDSILFNYLQKYGPLVGAIMGILPQCGFSVIASMLFVQRYISLGTLLAVFIATSDEAIPILLSNPQLYHSMLSIIILKLVIGIAAGYFIDGVLFKKQEITSFEEIEEEEEEEENFDTEDESIDSNACPCCYTQYPSYISALLRSLKIFAFILGTTIILNTFVTFVGEETLEKLLLTKSIFQPVLASSFGFIPNCAASVILTQLYLNGALSFASLISGLITNAGVGLLVLIRYEEDVKNLVKVVYLLLGTAIIGGMLLSMVI